MTGKELGQQPANPTDPIYCDNGYGMQIINIDGTPGMTKREAFALHAPLMPQSWDWTDHELEAEIKAAIQAEQEALPQDPEARTLCEAWRRDGTWDLDEGPEFNTFREAYEARQALADKRTVRYLTKAEAAWAVAYADALLDELAKERP